MTEEMLLDRMAQMIRVGFVNARQPEKMRVKVTVRDTTNAPLITDWLPVLCPRASGDMHYDLPDVGDQVLCLFLPYGLEQGFVVGAMYGKQVPPVQSGDKWHRTFSDGTTLEYDRASHALTADIPGTAAIKCSGPMTLEAPTVYVRGTFINTARDGSPGKSVFSGGMEVHDGGVNVSAGDVVAAGVSLVSHTTEGVQPGSGVSSHPSGGSSQSPDTAAVAAGAMSAALISAVLQEKEADVQNRGDKVDALIMCLPHIARAKAGEYREKSGEAADKGNAIKAHEYICLAEAWDKLATLLEKWIAAPPSTVKAVDGDEYVCLDWQWLMNFPRFANAYKTFTAIPPVEGKRNILNQAAKDSLSNYLCANGYMRPGATMDFDFIRDANNWRAWQSDYHTSYPAKPEYDTDEIEGSTVVLGGFSFRALARGTVEWISGNEYWVDVKEIAVIVWDAFNFDEEPGFLDEAIHAVFGLGFWRCAPPAFNVKPLLPDGTQLNNGDFRSFRNKKFGGTDFMVLTEPHTVENFSGERYKYVCENKSTK